MKNTRANGSQTRVFALTSVVIALLLLTNLALIFGGFASCEEGPSFASGLALMAFYFYGVPVAAGGAVFAWLAWKQGRADPSTPRHFTVLGTVLNTFLIVASAMMFSGRADVGRFFSVFGVDLSCA